MSENADVYRTDSGRRGSLNRTRRHRTGLVAMAVAVLALVFGAAAFAGVGKLSQKSGTEGCVSEDGTGGACADGVALDAASSVTVSPDGENAYATAADSNSVTVFDRDPSTGALTQKAGTAGCVSEDGTGGACADGKALGGAASVAVSPDGKNAYVASAAGFAVAVFDRNTSTGELTQKAGTAGCVSENGTSGFPDNTPGACVDGVALNGAKSVAVSADGKSAYVAAAFSDAVVIFDRNTSTGELTQKAGTAGCISETGTGGACTVGKATDGIQSVAVSPDGKSAYAASYFSDAVLIFDRNTSTGALTQKAIPGGCVSQTGSGGSCADGTALDAATSVTVSPDGKSAYATAYFSDSVTVFDRDTSTGALTQKSGTEGCISQTGTAGACVDGTALNSAISVAVSPDGKNAYVASRPPGNAIATFDRDTSTGALTQKTVPDGCISETSTGGLCGDGKGLDDAMSVTVSPDGKNAYAASAVSSAVAIFGVNDGKIDGKASASKTQKQKGKNIVVEVKVKTGEDLEAEASGKITVKKKSYDLKKVTKSIAMDKPVTLKMKPAKNKASKKIANALKKSKGKAKIDVTLSDDGGNSDKTKLSVALKAK